MSYSRRSRYSQSPSPDHKYRRSVSRSLAGSRSRSYDSSDAENPGNNLYVTGLSTRVTKRDLEKHFSTEGTVEEVHLVVDPWTRESRGFGFVTMSTVKEANRCIKYLNHSVLEGRVITIEKARRRRGRTPTPGRYLGLRTVCVRRRSPSYSPYTRSRSRSTSGYSSERYWSRSRSRSRSYSPRRRQQRSYSPFYSRRRSYSSYYCRRRSYSRSRSPYSWSPISKRDQSNSPYNREYSPDDRCYRSRRYRPISRSRRDRSYSLYDREYSPDDGYKRSRHYRSISRSISPRPRRYSRRSYSRSPSLRRSKRSYSHSTSPRHSRRSYSRSNSPPRGSRGRPSHSIPRTNGSSKSNKRADSQDSASSRSRSRSWSASASSRSVSRSVSPQSSSP